jgi:AraC-like DNA-binding protein
MNEQKVFTLINYQNGHLAFKILWFDDNSHFDHLQRNNFYSLIWVKKGNGLLKVDFSEYLFQENTLFTFAPYQPFMFSTDGDISGIVIQFHSDFYCIHKNPNETHCDTMLFNNIYQPPFIALDAVTQAKISLTIEQIKDEIKDLDEAKYELIIPYLKILLVTATRLKTLEKRAEPLITDAKMPFILHNLKAVIETHFKQKHSASDYAALLNISPNALAKAVKTHFNKTPTELIIERIIVEAKRELYMTNKPVKAIAYYLGYNDEFYFSRVFKTNTGVSPQMYRETVGFGKAEMGNLN